MDAQGIQDKIYKKGYGKSAEKLGFPFTIYRSPDGLDPIQPANIIGVTPMTYTKSWSYMSLPKFGENFWIGLIDGTLIQVGDFLVGDQYTFFVGSMFLLQPILVVLCDRRITIVRPKSPVGIGSVGYSGFIYNDPSTYDELHTNVPASFLKSSRGEKNPVDLPTSAKMPWYAVYLPQWASVFLRNGDIIIDDEQQLYKISDNEHTASGWHLNVHGLET